jgi:hypothetical protein
MSCRSADGVMWIVVGGCVLESNEVLHGMLKVCSGMSMSSKFSSPLEVPCVEGSGVDEEGNCEWVGGDLVAVRVVDRQVLSFASSTEDKGAFSVESELELHRGKRDLGAASGVSCVVIGGDARGEVEYGVDVMLRFPGGSVERLASRSV